MVSLITALIIQANGAEVGVYEEKGKGYGFELYSIIREKYRPHITSTPIFKAEEEAKTKGEELLKEIQKLDLDKKRKELSNCLRDTGPVVQKIIDGSKK